MITSINTDVLYELIKKGDIHKDMEEHEFNNYFKSINKIAQLNELTETEFVLNGSLTLKINPDINNRAMSKIVLLLDRQNQLTMADYQTKFGLTAEEYLLASESNQNAIYNELLKHSTIYDSNKNEKKQDIDFINDIVEKCNDFKTLEEIKNFFNLSLQNIDIIRLSAAELLEQTKSLTPEKNKLDEAKK